MEERLRTNRFLKAILPAVISEALYSREQKQVKVDDSNLICCCFFCNFLCYP